MSNQRLILLGPLVLALILKLFLNSTTDRDQTVSQRFKPSSRTILFDEQSNPWQRMLHQDMMSRHRGAKQSLR